MRKWNIGGWDRKINYDGPYSGCGFGGDSLANGPPTSWHNERVPQGKRNEYLRCEKCGKIWPLGIDRCLIIECLGHLVPNEGREFER